MKKRTHARMEPDASHVGRCCQRRHLRGEADPPWRVEVDEGEAAAAVAAVEGAKTVQLHTIPDFSAQERLGDRERRSQGISEFAFRLPRVCALYIGVTTLDRIYLKRSIFNNGYMFTLTNNLKTADSTA